jgi:hypothetical protein
VIVAQGEVAEFHNTPPLACLGLLLGRSPAFVSIDAIAIVVNAIICRFVEVIMRPTARPSQPGSPLTSPRPAHKSVGFKSSTLEFAGISNS